MQGSETLFERIIYTDNCMHDEEKGNACIPISLSQRKNCSPFLKLTFPSIYLAQMTCISKVNIASKLCRMYDDLSLLI